VPGVANARELLTSIDARDLTAALDLPQSWLCDDWTSNGVPS
jgi:hypothetical protein